MNRIILLILVLCGFYFCAFAQETEEEPAQDNATFFQKVGKFFLDLDAKADRIEQGEKKMAAGAGLELNLNARDTVAMGFPFTFDYNLPITIAPFAAGANVVIRTSPTPEHNA